jgi:peptide deformylase
MTGSVRPVVRAPAGVLSAAGDPVDPADPEVVALVADLFATMAVSPGASGWPRRRSGCRPGVRRRRAGHPKARTCHGAFALCNAEVVSASRWEKGREGCMSVPDLTGDVRRAANLVVAGVAPGTGEPVEIRTDAFEARALQHEIDHCAGLLFLDRVAGAHAVYARKTTSERILDSCRCHGTDRSPRSREIRRRRGPASGGLS